ncbi:MAG: XRE family transcriptional regulator [Bacteroidota bacterium]|nr:XRE family transcriptional regulator [Bacteroidota bacterium]
MNQKFAERLKSARIMNGLSLQDLADKIGNRISRQGLHKYEKGEVMPDSEMIGRLSEALGVRPEYFFRDVVVELGEIQFRKIQRFPVKEKNKVVEKTREVISRYLELEGIIGIEYGFSNPIKDVRINGTDDVEGAAATLRSKWNLGTDPIYNVVEILEDKHIKVIELDEMEGFDGLQTWVNGNIPVIVLNKGKLIQNDRKRFTALHELGHLLLDIAHLDEKEQEKCCHYFAGALLFPKDIAEIELGVKRSKLYINELGALKLQYGISIQALLYRLKNLQIISENYFKQFMFYMIHMGWKKEEPSEYEYRGMEESHRFTQLLFRALAEDLISMSKAASLNNQKLAEFREQSLMVR